MSNGIDSICKTPHIRMSMRYPKPYYDACKLQDKIMQASEIQGLKELANLAKSFATLESLKLRIRMKPAPKPIDVSADHKRKPRSTSSPAFTESPDKPA